MKYLFIGVLLLGLLTREFFWIEERHIYHENEIYKKAYSFVHEPKKNSMSQYFFSDGIMITVPLYPSYHYGEKVLVEGKIESKDSYKGRLLVVENPRISRIENTNYLLSFSKSVRQKVEGAVISTLPSKEGGLLLGVILGVRDKIDKEYYEQLRNSGVLHVIAASGQNVSIAATMLLIIFSSFVKRKIALVFTTVGVLIYAILTGFDPPIVRASIMAILAFTALFTGRQISSIYVLFLTGWGMLFVQPEEIIDVSFQLSFLSTFGILTVKPLLDTLIRAKFLNIVKDDITTTISAQIATFPLMLSAFGAYSLLSFPVNILVLWTIPIIMIFGGVAGLLSLLTPFLAKPFLLLCYPFLLYFRSVIELFAKVNLQIGIDSIPVTVIVGYYLILFAIVIKLKPRAHSKK